MVLGYLDEDGALKPEYRPSEVTKAASYCKVDLRAVHGLPPQAVRALAVLSDRCNGDKRSRARVPTLARASGRSVRAWHRAFVALVVAGWAWSRGRWRGLGRQQARADSGKRHTPFRRMSDLICSSRKEQQESDPAVPGGCDTLIQAQQRTARRPTQDELLAMPRAARVAALEAWHRVSPRGGKLPPIPRYGERFTALQLDGTRDNDSSARLRVTDPGRRPKPKKRRATTMIDVKVDLVKDSTTWSSEARKVAQGDLAKP